MIIRNRVSIILPIYNTEKKVFEACLQQLSAFQTPAFEYILVDDGSTAPHIKELCEKAVAIDTRFRYVFQENQGVSAARNTGIRHAKGTWLFFLDPDDLLTETAEAAFSQAAASQSDVVLFGFEEITLDNHVVRTFPLNKLVTLSQQAAPSPEKIMLATLRTPETDADYNGYYFGFPWGKMIRAAYLDKHRVWFPKDITKREDAWFILQLFSHQPAVTCIDEVVYRYRVKQQSSLSNSYAPELVGMFQTLLIQIKDMRYLFHDKDAFDDSYRIYCFDLMKELINLYFCNGLNPEDYEKRKAAFLAFRQTPEFSYVFNRVPRFRGPLWKKIIFVGIRYELFFGLNSIYLIRKLQLKRKRTSTNG